jgi:hypothetical protein
VLLCGIVHQGVDTLAVQLELVVEGIYELHPLCGL